MATENQPNHPYESLARNPFLPSQSMDSVDANSSQADASTPPAYWASLSQANLEMHHDRLASDTARLNESFEQRVRNFNLRERHVEQLRDEIRHYDQLKARLDSWAPSGPKQHTLENHNKIVDEAERAYKSKHATRSSLEQAWNASRASFKSLHKAEPGPLLKRFSRPSPTMEAANHALNATKHSENAMMLGSVLRNDQGLKQSIMRKSVDVRYGRRAWRAYRDQLRAHQETDTGGKFVSGEFQLTGDAEERLQISGGYARANDWDIAARKNHLYAKEQSLDRHRSDLYANANTTYAAVGGRHSPSRPRLPHFDSIRTDIPPTYSESAESLSAVGSSHSPQSLRSTHHLRRI